MNVVLLHKVIKALPSIPLLTIAMTLLIYHALFFFHHQE
jgi:hypothetical protein